MYVAMHFTVNTHTSLFQTHASQCVEMPLYTFTVDWMIHEIILDPHYHTSNYPHKALVHNMVTSVYTNFQNSCQTISH